MAKSYTIKLKIKRLDVGNFHIFASGRVNNFPVNICIDTGASRTLIDKQFYLEHFSEMLPKAACTIGATIGTSQMDISIAKLHKFSIGRLNISEFEVAAVEIKTVNDAYKMVGLKPIQIILGNDFLVPYHAIINYQDKLLTLNI